ncbi:MAG: polysaccharide biosynthesis C-terminal domain-containing protein [Planctomycetota bacterium]
MRFKRWVVFTFAFHVLIIVVDKGAGLIVLKIFEDNPDVKGAIDLLAALPFIMMSMANLGLATSSVFFLRREQFDLVEVAETNSLVALVWGTLLAGVAVLLSQTLLPALKPDWDFDLAYVVPICLCVPLLLTSSYFNSLQLVLEHIRNYNLVNLFGSIAFLPLFLLFYFGGSFEGASAAAMSRLVGSAVVCGITLWMLRSVVRWRPRLHWNFLRAGITYGWKANLTSVLTYLNHRLDLYLVGFLYVHRGGATTGFLKPELAEAAFYSQAVTFAELIWHFPEALRDLFFSKVAGSTHEQARQFTPVLSRLCLAVAVVGSLAVWVAVDPFMGLWLPNAWESTWRDTVRPSLLVLMPGTVAYTVAKILQNDLAARGHLDQCLQACFIVLVVMVSLDIALIPRMGAVGAAWASTVAYWASAIYSLWAYRAHGGASVMKCLIPRREDLKYARELYAAVREKIGGRRA